MSESNGARSPDAVDPYAGYRYRVLVDGHVVAGVSTISPLRRQTEVIEFREGAKPGAIRRLPGVTSYDPIRLERGITIDWDFEQWAGRVCFFGREPDEPDPNFRKDILIEAVDESGDVKVAYQVFRCWPSEYLALAPADAEQPTEIEAVTLQHEGWERVGADTVAQRTARVEALTDAEGDGEPVESTGITLQVVPLPGEAPVAEPAPSGEQPANGESVAAGEQTPAGEPTPAA